MSYIEDAEGPLKRKRKLSAKLREEVAAVDQAGSTFPL
jgi:hypothetical protein